MSRRLEAQRRKLEDLPGWTWNVKDRQFQEGLAELRSWLADENGRWPAQGERTVGGFNIGTWVHTKRSSYRKDILPPDQIAALEGLGIQWTLNLRLVRGGTGVDAKWREIAEGASRWALCNGRIPKTTGTEEEGYYSGWLRRQKKRFDAGKLGGWQADYLDTYLQGWRLTREEMYFAAWVIPASELVEWAKVHGRLPDGWDVDEGAIRLREWLLATRRVSIATDGTYSGAWTPARHEYLDNNLPGWNQPDLSWRQKVDRTARFVGQNGSLPRIKCNDKDERRLGIFLAEQRRNAAGGRSSEWTEERQAYLDAQVPGWRAGRYGGDWERRVVELRSFVHTHEALPDRYSAAATERALAEWLRGRKSEALRNRLTAERRDVLDAIWPGWMTTRTDSDMQIAMQVIEWIDAESRAPSRGGDDADERRFASWLSGRRNRRRPSNDIDTMLDAKWPHWRDGRFFAWSFVAQKVAGVVKTKGLLLKHDSEDVDEAFAYCWLITQRRLVNDGKSPLSMDKKDWLDANIPGWQLGLRERA